MDSPSFKDKFRYFFHNTMSKGSIAQIAWLSLLTAIFVIAAAIAVMILGNSPEKTTPDLIIWSSLMHAFDSGTLSGDGGGWSYRLTMLVVTLGGILFTSILIGLLTNGIQNQIEILRRGRSKVIEKDHYVILGWNEQIFTVISELILSGMDNKEKKTIVIMAEKDKVDMEAEIADKVEAIGKTRIICRSGNPIEAGDLEIVNLDTVKSIIILPNADENIADAQVIKTILAITKSPTRRQAPYHIVAGIHKTSNYQVAKMVGGNEVELIADIDTVARIMVQTSLQPGLSLVYTDLFDYEGDELYIHHEPQLGGNTFAQAKQAFRNSAVIGIYRKEDELFLNPPGEMIIDASDNLIVLAPNKNSITSGFIKTEDIYMDAITAAENSSRYPLKILILGWNERATFVISQLNEYVPAGTKVDLICNNEYASINIELKCPPLLNMKLNIQNGDTTDRKVLESINIYEYDHVIVLAPSDDSDIQQVDAQTMITLLHLRDMVDKNEANISITAEMFDIRNRNLVASKRADDFVVSPKLLSQMMTQIANDKKLAPIFFDLLDPEGCEIYLKPAEKYVRLNAEVNFYTVVAAASVLNETAIGYRIVKERNNPDANYGVVLNPDKAAKLVFEQEDQIIVLSETDI